PITSPIARAIVGAGIIDRNITPGREDRCGRNPKPAATEFSSYEHGEDKRGTHATGNHFILSSSQWRIITAEMLADQLAVDDQSKRAAGVADIIASVALLDHEGAAR